ncbi:MAG: type II toxin-antitoxin system RelE/ParE family toxin [Saprospiraceae bacterium]|jgi:hypothetical protein|nr:type II toxin-antitoxin system RelE/ParE family toxin [Saprospiraceae bacterium]
MSYSIEGSKLFTKQLRRLVKKYPSLKDDFAELIKSLEVHPTQGDKLGKNCYKIRIAIASKHRGKSGGARVITFVHVVNTKVFLLTIYDKSEQNDISDKDLIKLLSKIIEF